MKRPADQGGQNRGDDARVAQPLPRRSTCPWPCLYAHQHTELADPTGRVQATMCLVCQQLIARQEWEDEVFAYAHDDDGRGA